MAAAQHDKMFFIMTYVVSLWPLCTGATRGFGFVEFQSQQEAQRWMDHNQVDIDKSLIHLQLSQFAFKYRTSFGS